MIDEICCSPSLSWSQPLCDCVVSVSLCLFVLFFFFFFANSPIPLLAISALPFLIFPFFSLSPLDLARPTPCRYVSSHIHCLSASPPPLKVLSKFFPITFVFLFSDVMLKNQQQSRNN
ncbi:hypothetical protein ACB098_04G060500 [Castanea mollissima]